MNEFRTIYGLFDPDAPLTVRYIGQTKKRLHVRLSEHVADANRGQKNYRCNWIRQLLHVGKRPIIQLLETVDADDVEAAEMRWIAEYRATLTNTTDGGEGAKGMPEDVIRRIVESRAWYKHSEETCQKISYAKKGKPLSEANVAALRISNSKPRSDEHKAKLGAARKAATVTDETKAKLSESGKKSWAEGKRTVHPNTIAACKANCDKQRGVPLTDEHRANVGKASKRAIRTPEWKAAISNGIKLHWEKRKASSSV